MTTRHKIIGAVLTALLALSVTSGVAAASSAYREIASCFVQSNGAVDGVGSNVEKLPLSCRTSGVSGYRHFRVRTVLSIEAGGADIQTDVFVACHDGDGNADQTLNGEFHNLAVGSMTDDESLFVSTAPGDAYCDVRVNAHPNVVGDSTPKGYLLVQVFGKN